MLNGLYAYEVRAIVAGLGSKLDGLGLTKEQAEVIVKLFVSFNQMYDIAHQVCMR